jgi:hypothetical protein
MLKIADGSIMPRQPLARSGVGLQATSGANRAAAMQAAGRQARTWMYG